LITSSIAQNNNLLWFALNEAYTLSIGHQVFTDRTMTTLVIPDTLAERLQHVAQQENRPLEDVLASMLDLYARQADAFAAMEGMFDDDVPDLSSSVRDTMSGYYQKKYGRLD
jgi:hypothetical protein